MLLGVLGRVDGVFFVYDPPMAILGILFLVIFLLPFGTILVLWWQDRLSRGVKVTIVVLGGCFIGWVAISDAFWTQTGKASWSSWGKYQSFAGGDRLPWWRGVRRNLEDFTFTAPPITKGLAVSYDARAVANPGWEKRATWVLFWVIGGLVLYALKHRKVKVPALLAFIALCGFFLWAVRRPPDVRMHLSLSLPESQEVVRLLNLRTVSAAELLPIDVWQACGEQWRADDEAQGDLPLDYEQALALMTVQDGTISTLR